MLDYDTSDADYFKYVYWSGFDGTCMSEESYSRTYLFDTLGNCIASPDSVVKVTNSAIFQSHSYFSASTVPLTTGNIEKIFFYNMGNRIQYFTYYSP